MLAFNEYPGWYTESIETINATWANFSAWAYAHYPRKPFLISETGAGAIYEWDNTSAHTRVDGYSVGRGAITRGGDLGTLNVTLGAAIAHCNATRGCRGFTFESPALQPEGALKVYFKSGEGVNSDGRWVAYVNGPPRPPKWSQGFQADIVGLDVRSALSLPHVSGISLWQFSDIKADDAATKACKSCVYAGAYDALTPMNCSYISAACWRPGGENHKGLVDFWRRPKQAFHLVKKLYAS